MTIPESRPGSSGAATHLLEPSHLQRLIDVLRADGYCVIATTLRDGAIVHDEVSSVAELPAGWTDEQQPGVYRLRRRGDGALFGYAVGPTPWKRFLHPPLLRLWRVHRVDGRVELVPEDAAPPKYAFVGVRACDLTAIARLDDVLLDGPYVDASYRAVRGQALFVAVNCAEPGGTCFCESMGTGPRVGDGADLVLTEVVADGRHYFTARGETARGQELLSALECARATADEVDAGERAIADAPDRMGRTLRTDSLREAIYAQPEHPRWEHVAKRCLTCGNCTLSCPTCFCTTVEDATALAGSESERRRRWDTCFAVEFSYMYGGSVRLSTRSRYRQWLTHKLSTWHDQFGTFGCVGCGRCITWCPVGIDITVEAAAVRQRVSAGLGQSLTE